MTIRVKKNRLFFFVFLLLVFAAFFTFAQDLEVKYPTIPGIPPLPEKPLLPEYVRYLYYFSIIIAGLVAFASLVYGGFRYLTSAGSPVAMADARSQITAGIIGLLILLGSFLILTTINPQLRFLKIARTTLAKGVILYDSPGCQKKGREGENFIYVGRSIPDLGDFSNKAKSIYFFNPSKELKVYIFPEINWEPKEEPSWESAEPHDANTCSSINTDKSRSIFLQWQKEGMPDIAQTSEWYEIPVGSLITELLDLDRLGGIEATVHIAEGKAKAVLDAAADLQNAIKNCKCENLVPNAETCVAGQQCPATACTDPANPGKPGDPCPNREDINKKRQELRNAYLAFEDWLAKGTLYSLAADFAKDATQLRIAQILLEEGQLPLNYDAFLEFKQAAKEAGGEVKILSLDVAGETLKGKGDPTTFYFEKGINEDRLAELILYLGAKVGELKALAEVGWAGISFPIAPGTQLLAWPTTGCISQWFDTYRPDLYIGGCHKGIDIANTSGTEIRAAKDGKVNYIETQDNDHYGIYVVLEHQYGGVTFYTLYSHLSEPAPGLDVGDQVKQGDLIGYMDNTGLSAGDHLHFGLYTGQAPWGVPYDPELYLSAGFPICSFADSSLRNPEACAPPEPPFASPPGAGSCDVGELEPVFGDYATAASCICGYESGGNPLLVNDGCLDGVSCDYSVGLFQINLLAHCSGALNYDPNTCIDNPWCTVADQTKLTNCLTTYQDAVNNIQKAFDLFEGSGYDWTPWTNAAKLCGLPY